MDDEGELDRRRFRWPRLTLRPLPHTIHSHLNSRIARTRLSPSAQVCTAHAIRVRMNCI